MVSWNGTRSNGDEKSSILPGRNKELGYELREKQRKELYRIHLIRKEQNGMIDVCVGSSLALLVSLVAQRGQTKDSQ